MSFYMFYQYSAYFSIFIAAALIAGFIWYYTWRKLKNRSSGPAGIMPIVHEQVIENIADGILFFDQNNRLADFNKAFVNIFGNYNIKIGDKVDEVFSSYPDFINFCNSETEQMQEIIIDPSKTIPYLAKSIKLNKGIGNLGTIVILHMIEKQESDSSEIKESHNLLYNIIDFLPDATFAIDTDGKVIAWNKSLEKMTGIEKSDIVGKGDNEYSDVFYGDNEPMLIDYFLKKDPCLKNKHDYLGFEVENLESQGFLPKLNGGKGAFLWATASPLFNSKGGLIGAIETVRDITNIKEIENKLFYLSSHDSLTGLYNRNYFEDNLKRIDSLDYYPISILMADIKGLKLINDAFGNSSGDELLRHAANCIQKHCGPQDIAARWGGDEFIAMLFNTDADRLKILVEKISRECKKTVDGARTLSIVFGAATENTDKKSIYEVIKEAENQMYRHKLLKPKNIQNSRIKSLAGVC
jgi:diguanylate cyclase (GGDEF)-like protein